MKIRRIAIVSVLILSMLLLTACGGSGDSGAKDEPKAPVEVVSMDEEALANQLLEKVNFDCTLYQVSDAGIDTFLGLEDAECRFMFMGNGSYADSFGIFTAADKSAAEEMKATVDEYLAEVGESFKAYIPEEAEKVANALSIIKGQYVVFCVTNDTENAENVINGAMEVKEIPAEEYEAMMAENGESEAASDIKDETLEEGEAADSGDNEIDLSKYPAVEDSEYTTVGFTVVAGDAGFELYSYDDSAAEAYAECVNKTAEAAGSKIKVYDVLIPLSSGITLPNNLYGEIQSSNQKKALNNIVKKMNDNVITVNPYENLMNHRDEYIYFRTDHHWTALGAYYTYEELARAKGVLPISLARREHKTFEDFLGSFATDTKSEALKENPDSVDVYYPLSDDVEMKYTEESGKEVEWDVIHNPDAYPEYMKYSAFIAGDNPLTYIRNNNLSDGSVCVVVKESFGNAFVPFLVDHYEKIYVVDYRYWQGNLAEFAKEKKADDIIFANNLSMIRSSYLVGKLQQIV